MPAIPLWNPVAKNNFYVFLVNANPRNAIEGVAAAASFLVGAGLALVQGTFSEVTCCSFQPPVPAPLQLSVA